MGHKTAETTCNIICKDKNLEDEECSGQPLQVDNDRQQSAKLMLKADSQHEKLSRTQSTILWLFRI